MADDKRYWNKWYAVVLVFLALQIVCYYFLSAYFNKG
jgi:hypothetical protein